MALKLMLDQLNELLTRLGEANDGTNHGSEYALYDLPSADTLQHALDQYFSQISTSNTLPQPADAWAIRTTAVDDSEETLPTVARHWFYELEYSSKVNASVAADTVRDAHASRFNYDLDAIFQDIKEREKKSGLKFVQGVARQPVPNQAILPTGAADSLNDNPKDAKTAPAAEL